jgi:translation initiation factor 2B subunit (eIF-2B alpha/beta/delta family)
VDALATVQTEVGTVPVAAIARRADQPVALAAAAPQYHPLFEHLVNSLVKEPKTSHVKMRLEIEVEPLQHTAS